MPEDEHSNSSLRHANPSGPVGLGRANQQQPTSSSASNPTTYDQVPGFVAPSSYLRPRAHSKAAAAAAAAQPVRQMSELDIQQIETLRTVRHFLRTKTSYDVLPLSYRLIVFDTSLLIKQGLDILVHNGIVSAPLWDSKTSTFAGLLTTLDFINVIQYYWQHPDALKQLNTFRLDSLREIERAIGVTPIETVSIHPLKPLYEICHKMVQSRARRMPIVDEDDETRRNMVVSVITQYRILKFIAVNNQDLSYLRKPLSEVNVGTRTNIATATMDTPVIDVIHMLVKRSISSVPIVDSSGVLLNVFEAVDVIALIKGGSYDELEISVGAALLKRPESFTGIIMCQMQDGLDTIFDILRKSRVHRFVIIDEQDHLKGILSLSDILEYLLVGEGE